MISIYLTHMEAKDIHKLYPNTTIERDYNSLLDIIKQSISQGYILEIYYGDDFIVTMQDILSRFNQLNNVRTYRIMDKMLNEYSYIYKPRGDNR